ncbi:hypothetical protein ATANTOWER_027594 [Ataeniobius toweri]|uniref:Uncharacterized protein n=1 Tax=Ataeniobius toweri TaxID=208326 RepID=A0ABU7BA87_9TELE|nr:hypothetical protein [Ataeniobius toweri]
MQKKTPPPPEVQRTATEMQKQSASLQNTWMRIYLLFSISFFYGFKKKRKTKKRDYLSQILDCIYFNLYIMCREKKTSSDLCYFTFSLFRFFVAWILRNVLIQMFVCYSMQIVCGILLLLLNMLKLH